MFRNRVDAGRHLALVARAAGLEEVGVSSSGCPAGAFPSPPR